MKENRLIIVGHTGIGHQRGWVYDPNGICPCLSATQYKQATATIVNESKDEKEN